MSDTFPDRQHFHHGLMTYADAAGIIGKPVTKELIDTFEAQVKDYYAANQSALVFGATAKSIHDLHTQKGFYDTPRSVSHLMGLVMTELAEVIEADRKFENDTLSEKIPEFTHEEEEVADAVIRLLDFAGYRELRIGAAILAKHAYNATRPSLHGKRY